MSSNRTVVILLVVIIVGGGVAFAYTVPIITEYYLDIEQREIGRDDDFILEPNDLNSFHFTFAGDTRVEFSVSASDTVNLYIMTPSEFYNFPLNLYRVSPDRMMEGVSSGTLEYEVEEDDTFYFVLNNPHSGFLGLVGGDDVWINSLSVTYDKEVFRERKITIIESLTG